MKMYLVTETELSAMTDASTGVSTLSVTTDVPGYYSCKVSLLLGRKE